jgi:septal ring factor EnvC (AmiA/AmiB activator)
VLAIRNTFRVDDLEKDIEETKGLIDENFEIIEDDLKDFTETMESMSNVDDEMIDTVGTINENHRMIADILENIILRVKKLERDCRCDEPV